MISNPEKVNLTAYAVLGTQDLFVTVINKEHGATARTGNATIVSPGTSRHVEIMYLTALCGDVTAKTGIILGGASTSNGLWAGKWTILTPDRAGGIEIKVSAASAVVAKLSLK